MSKPSFAKKALLDRCAEAVSNAHDYFCDASKWSEEDMKDLLSGDHAVVTAAHVSGLDEDEIIEAVVKMILADRNEA
ncbi:hypothetical protein HFM15_001519 [Vibrio cholerae]|nr:hypothetical protein [Vibrio cholerae]EJL6679716.1 hypothetical protein [Vibrio cholerae]